MQTAFGANAPLGMHGQYLNQGTVHEFGDIYSVQSMDNHLIGRQYPTHSTHITLGLGPGGQVMA
jgi:hypothetical protein